ncbi:MAG: AAA family ATPase, partial [Acutalibacteraceae bacterium]|nr:AAA family ATPase [Acutalibacteraceae bacterium]
MSAPLADRLRPQKLEDVVGQRHLLAEGKALRRIIDSGQIPNMVFYGPSGVGKTTLATMIAKTTNRKLVKMNGTTASTSDIKDVISNLNTFETMNGVLLYLDEIQYFNKKQQQILLEFIENGQITLIASTTENPYFYVYNAVLSRCTVFEFKSVPQNEIERAVQRGFLIVEQELEQTIQLENGVASYIATACGGDVRKAMNAVELCSLSADKTE